MLFFSDEVRERYNEINNLLMPVNYKRLLNRSGKKE
jgi:hypothetical protein